MNSYNKNKYVFLSFIFKKIQILNIKTNKKVNNIYIIIK